MRLTAQQQRWASKSRQGASARALRKILEEQQGLCGLSGAKMIFDVNQGRPVKGGVGTHPLYVSVDHKDPGNSLGGYQIVCYALNDLKGHLPVDCFNALVATPVWQSLMDKWRRQAKMDSSDRKALMRLLRPNAAKIE